MNHQAPEVSAANSSTVRPASVRISTALQSAIASSRRAGLPHYVAAILSVQGTAYLAQLAIARMVGPAEFGVVRTVEAVLNVTLIAASLGAPMLAVTITAALPTSAEQGCMLGRLLTLCIFGGLVTAAGLTLAAPLFGPSVQGYLQALAWLLCLTSCGRTCLNYFLGRKEVHRLALYSVGLAALSLVLVVGAVWLGGLRGWVVGRYFSEVLFLGFMVLAVGRTLRFGWRSQGDAGQDRGCRHRRAVR